MPSTAFEKALELLTRREYSRCELLHKLQHKGFPADQIERALAELVQKGWQSDQRFAESFIRARQLKGQGPIKIAYELRERGVAEELIIELLDEQTAVWQQLIFNVWVKKFGPAKPSAPQEMLKQKRFLAGRGFSYVQINQLYSK